MKVDVNTLTKEQKRLISLGYNIFINDEGKLVIEDPVEKTQEYIDFKTKEIKKDYNIIILDNYSYTDQINMSAEIQEIHLTARLEDRAFTEDEMLKVQQATEMKYWIQSQIDECNQKILDL